ncbi:DUF4395 family protein [Brevibacillus fulvus]|uniref:DUF4395 domain-containing protein n=1 Tax=Brevibacillus fulvus TaxID=1125967 RepID=A0A938XSF7_9BACL|nr:DUF4395 family protein [Brevibacillus fulvus]MBM7589538.1 hypothetical protein [Brevibacillus fulvus]
MREIPRLYVSVIHVGVIMLVLLAILFQQPLFILALWLIHLVSLASGGRFNLFVCLVKPLLDKRKPFDQYDSLTLFRFNAAIALLLETLAVCSFYLLHAPLWGFVFSGIHAAAALLALSGFCFGCFLFFQFKQWKWRRTQ